MSTRATVHFQSNSQTEAIVYRHSDGYPDGLGKESWNKTPIGPLNFLGVGVVLRDPFDIEYRYQVACENDKPPKVEVEHIS